MAFEKQAAFSKKVTDLPDRPSPTFTATDIKNHFQTPDDENRNATNNLIDALNANTGASNVGAKDESGLTTTVQGRLDKLHTDKASKESLSNTDARIDNIVASGGESNVEIVDARYDSVNAKTYTNLSERLNNTTLQLADLMNNDYSGKKYVAVGDSITYGFVPSPYTTLVSDVLKMTGVNMGVSGSMITVDPAKTDSIFERRADIPVDADVISIFGGTNDFGHTVVPMGQFGDTLYSNGFYGTVYELIKWILDNRPNAKLFFITPLPRVGMNTENGFGYILEDYVNAIIDVCNYWSVPVLDFYHDSALSPLSSAIATQYYDAEGLHPLQSGHDLLSVKIIEFMRGL